MGGRAPSYDAVEYWDEKYAKDQDPFDWLLPAHSLREALDSALKDCRARTEDEPAPRILHIGSGTSLLSFALKNLVEDPSLVHNVDFSREAVEWGKGVEESMRRVQSGSPKADNRETETDEKRMKWMQASLLSVDSIVKSGCVPSTYSLVVDKSTADSIACGSDIEVRFPFPLHCLNQETTSSNEKDKHVPEQSSALLSSECYVHPLHILALHLALLTIPGAIWICFSYSADRFRFLEPDPGPAEGNEEGAEAEAFEDDEALPPGLVARGFPDPRWCWTLENTVAVETAEKHQREDHVVHRPVALHYMYTLRRTDVKLSLREPKGSSV